MLKFFLIPLEKKACGIFFNFLLSFKKLDIYTIHAVELLVAVLQNVMEHLQSSRAPGSPCFVAVKGRSDLALL